jgi:hypothetical protein
MRISSISAASLTAREDFGGPCGVVGARGDLQARVLEDRADRLDPEPVAVPVYVLDEHGGGPPRLLQLAVEPRRRKNTDAVFKISLARRSSGFLLLDLSDPMRVRHCPGKRCRRRPRPSGPRCVTPPDGWRAGQRSASSLRPCWPDPRARIEREPRRPVLQSLAVLKGCCHGSHPSQT